MKEKIIATYLGYQILEDDYFKVNNPDHRYQIINPYDCDALSHSAKTVEDAIDFINDYLPDLTSNQVEYTCIRFVEWCVTNANPVFPNPSTWILKRGSEELSTYSVYEEFLKTTNNHG